MNKEEHTNKINKISDNWFNARRSRLIAKASYDDGYDEACKNILDITKTILQKHNINNVEDIINDIILKIPNERT